MNPIGPTTTSAPSTAPADVAVAARDVAIAGDLDATAAFVRANPEQRGAVEQAMRDNDDTSGIFGLAERLAEGVQSLIDGALGAIEGIEAPPPVVGIDSPGWPTPAAAAEDALNQTNPKSIAQNREFGGYIFETADGTYGWTTPVRGSTFGVDVSKSVLPDGVRIVGVYHTHGDYTETLPGGDTRRTTPERDETNADQFSLGDLLSAQPGIQEYLGTPSGEFLWYNPDSGKTYTL